jgi:formate dehydrogenase subunit gamma
MDTRSPSGVATPLTPTQTAVVAASLARLADQPGALLPILHDLQAQLGYVPQAALPQVAKALNLSLADVHGVVTFYHDFRSQPPGAHVLKVCRAEACQAVGGAALEAHLAARCGVACGDTSPDGKLTVEAVYCLGNCALGPSVQFDGELVARCDVARLDELLAAARVATSKARSGGVA